MTAPTVISTATPNEPIAVDEGRKSGALVSFRRFDESSLCLTDKAFFLSSKDSSSVRLTVRQTHVHCTVPLVIWVTTVLSSGSSVVLSKFAWDLFSVEK